MEIAKRCAAGTPAIGYTKRDFIAEINKRAEPLRAADPKLTQEQAFARYVKGYTDGQILMKASMVAHPDRDEAPAAQAAPMSPSQEQLNALAQAMADSTGCTFAQGYARVLGTKQGAELYQKYKDEFTDGWMTTAEAYQRSGAGSQTPGQARTIDKSGEANGAAYDKMMEKAVELRKSQPALTEAQAFAKVFADPANHALAVQERRDNRPTGQQ
jgi:hypothetical protein